MFGFGKRKRDESPALAEAPPQEEDRGLFARLKSRLVRSRDQIGDRLASLLRGRQSIDADVLEELETLLLTADLGVDATVRIIGDLSSRGALR